MNVLNKKEPLVLFLGDIVLFLGTIWLSLVIRYRNLPEWSFVSDYLKDFILVIIIWVMVFFIAGLYERHTLTFRKRLPGIILKAQVANSILASLFFYFLPNANITPKTILLIQLALSFLAILAWRIYGYLLLGPTKKQEAILIGEGEEMRELFKEINNNTLYGIKFVEMIDVSSFESTLSKEHLENVLKNSNANLLVVDVSHPKISVVVPNLFGFIFSNIKFVELHKLYEEIFGKIPLSLVNESWFIENISNTNPKFAYEISKRVMDIVFGSILFLFSIPFYPVIFALIKIGDGGPIFINQFRVGKDDKEIKIVKFRTMNRNDNGFYDKNNPNKVTRIGAFLRRTHLDEIPQFWSVIVGDLSLVGPRSELPELVRLYKTKVPYYNVRHLVKPGLSGWAQIYHENHPHHEADEKETKTKLSYDLFYIKNRSFAIDLAVVLKTINVLFRGI